MTAIELKNVTYISSPDTPFCKTALDDVSLSITAGRITGLMGHTGSGKSTLVQLLNGLLKPDSGEVLLDGVNIWAEPKKIRDVRFRAGLVMQYPEYQLFAETVGEDIAFGPKNMGISGDELAERVKKSAEFAGLPEKYLDKSPFELSGGQKRRAALAGVIAMNPEILILDEPAAGLDPSGRRDILGGIKKFSRASGTTVIIVSHSMEDMARYCDDIVVLAHGRCIMQGSTPEVFARSEELSAVGLNVPEISRVCSMLRARGVPMDEGIFTVEQAEACLCRLLAEDGKEGRI